MRDEVREAAARLSRHWGYIETLDIAGRFALYEAACRACRIQAGLSPDSRCHANCNPWDAWCPQLQVLIDERMEG